jgi:hypothetical protein
MRHELADVQRQLGEAQQRIAAELQARAEDADRFEAVEERLRGIEDKAREEAARLAAANAEIEGLRSQLQTADGTLADLCGELEARDARLEENLVACHELTGQLESRASLLREATARLAEREAELAARTSERDTEKSTRTRLERELEEMRVVFGAARAKSQEMGKRMVSLGQELAEALGTKEQGSQAEPVAGDRATSEGIESNSGPPSPPAHGTPRTASSASAWPTAAPSQSEGDKSQSPPDLLPARPPASVVQASTKTASRSGGFVFMLAGIAIAAVAFFLLKATRSSSTALGGSPLDIRPATVAPGGDTDPSEPTAMPAATNAQPQDATEAGAALPIDANNGVVVFPPDALGHRIFVDGRVVEPTDARVEVRCGNREVRIGSQGALRKLYVACGKETSW